MEPTAIEVKHGEQNENCLALDTSFPEDQALVELVGTLRDCKYHFTTVTPLTQARVNARANNSSSDGPRRRFRLEPPF